MRGIPVGEIVAHADNYAELGQQLGSLVRDLSRLTFDFPKRPRRGGPTTLALLWKVRLRAQREWYEATKDERWISVPFARERIEEVFGLTGGELEDKPWFYDPPLRQLDARREGQSNYSLWFEGVPDHVSSRELPHDKWGATYRTALVSHTPYERITDIDGTWRLVFNDFGMSETECPYRQKEKGPGVGTVSPEDRSWVADEGDLFSGHCGFCEEQRGYEHGYIYLGDSWGHAVYMLEGSEE
jgi:hypothetical protein